MTNIITFPLGANSQPAQAPTLPEPLDQTVYQTREAVRQHQAAQQRYWDYQRQVANQARIDADNQRAKDLANAQREQTDAEYDALKLKQWQDQKDKDAARLQKEKDDAMARTAYLLSSPPIADLQHRSEFAFLKDFEHWVQRDYTLEADGLLTFQPGFYHCQLAAPAATAPKKASK